MIRKMRPEDKDIFLAFSRDFYASEAVLHPVPESYHETTFAEMMRSEDYAVGYIFEWENRPVGYAQLSKTFSHEAGGLVIWIEELYVLPEYRSKGLGSAFFKMLLENPGNGVTRLRLEVEEENDRALALYKRLGFTALEYDSYILDFPPKQ